MTGTPHHLRRSWRTIDFRPAPTGWRAIFLYPSLRQVIPVPGWLIQESYRYDPVSDEPQDDDDPERRVIAGVSSAPYSWHIEPVDIGGDSPWTILAPGEPEPTAEEEQAERARRAEDERQRKG